MLPIPARSCQRAVSTITDARALRSFSPAPRGLGKVTAHHLFGAAAGLLALAYLLDFAGLQMRLILLLQDWSTLLRSSNDAIVSATVAVAPFLLGILLFTLCFRLLGPQLRTHR